MVVHWSVHLSIFFPNLNFVSDATSTPIERDAPEIFGSGPSQPLNFTPSIVSGFSGQRVTSTHINPQDVTGVSSNADELNQITKAPPKATEDDHPKRQLSISSDLGMEPEDTRPKKNTLNPKQSNKKTKTTESGKPKCHDCGKELANAFSLRRHRQKYHK